jgi:hypothetical protein
MSSSVQFSGESKLVTPIRQSIVVSSHRQVASMTAISTLQRESRSPDKEANTSPAKIVEPKDVQSMMGRPVFVNGQMLDNRQLAGINMVQFP